VTLQVATFALTTILIATYLVLDGGDLGIGILCPFLGRNCGQRSVLQAAAGPVWNGNEAWLLLAGCVALVGFPGLRSPASSAALPGVIVVFAALALRAVAVGRSRGETASGTFWDAIFFLGSLAPALAFGLAAGTLVRGAHPDSAADHAGGLGQLLDPFTMLVAITGLALFVVIGAAWSALRTEGQVHNRSWIVLNVASVVLTALIAALGLLCVLTLQEFSANVLARSAGRLSLAVLAAALVLLRIGLARRLELLAWACSATVVAALIGVAATGVYPPLAPALTQAGAGLTVQTAAADPSTLATLLVAAVAAITLLAMYTVRAYRASWGRATPTPHGAVLTRRREVPGVRHRPAQRSQ
jgi:cytochrome bd ubiquinol oxidase subunit II